MSRKRKRRTWTAGEKPRFVFADLDGSVETSELCWPEGIHQAMRAPPLGCKPLFGDSALAVFCPTSDCRQPTEKCVDRNLSRCKKPQVSDIWRETVIPHVRCGHRRAHCGPNRNFEIDETTIKRFSGVECDRQQQVDANKHDRIKRADHTTNGRTNSGCGNQNRQKKRRAPVNRRYDEKQGGEDRMPSNIRVRSARRTRCKHDRANDHHQNDGLHRWMSLNSYSQLSSHKFEHRLSNAPSSATALAARAERTAHT